ncbi:MAG: DeoR/GlpR transcriptional regulator [Methylocystaceae bacterium]|nr:DeoR/GlpR transcriptional regulator [Methylocystaceae bacterium]
MLATERHKHILTFLKANKQVSANELADMLNVSRETVRRDLKDLEFGGKIKRVHGGAILTGPGSEAPFETRKTNNMGAKREIARSAAELVRPGTSLFIDAGTTTSTFARELAKIPEIMVVTNSIEIATHIKSVGNKIDVLLLGGSIVTDVPATFGELTLDEIRRFNLDLAFIAPVSVDAKSGAYSYDYREAEIARAMISQSVKLVTLADSSKIGKTNRVHHCNAEDISILVTDSKADKDQIEIFKKAGVRVIY